MTRRESYEIEYIAERIQKRSREISQEETRDALRRAAEQTANIVSSAGIRLDQLLQTGATAGQVVTWNNVTGEWEPADASSLTDPTTTEGDVIYRDGSGLQRLGIGTAGQRLTVNSAETAPEWVDVYALRNVLINGDFAIWQRLMSGSAIAPVADDEYIADRWYVLSETGNIEASRFIGITRRYRAYLVQKQVTAQRVGLTQIVEGANCRHLRGDQVTLSFRTRCFTTQDVRYAVLEWTGTEDAVTSDVVATWAATPTWVTNVAPAGSVGSTSVGTTWTDIEHTVTLGSTFNNLVVFIWSGDTVEQNRNISIEAAQLEQGPYKTPFETRPIGMELALCQRYFERREAQGLFQILPDSSGLITGAQAARIPFAYSEKRVAPSLTVINTFDLLGFSSGSLAGNTATLSFSFILTQGCQISATTTSGSYATGDACYLRAATSSGASLDIDAEL
jgi:hypothetical protein